MILNNPLFKNYSLLNFFFILFPVALVSGPFFSDLIVVIFSFYLIFYCYRNKNYFIYLKNSKIFWFYILFFFYLILNIFLSNYSLIELKSGLFHFRFIFFSLAIFLILKNNKKILDIFFKMLFLILIILIIDSHFQYFFGFNLIGAQLVSKMRVSSFFMDELILGGFILKLSIIFFSIAFYKKKHNLIYIFPFLISTIILSGERTSIALTLIYILGILLIEISIKKKIILFFSFILVFILQFNFNKEFKYNFSERISEEVIFNFSKDIKNNDVEKKTELPFKIFTQQHTNIYNNAFSIFRDNVFFGTGPNTFRFECQKYNNKDGCSTHPHNFFLQTLAEIGLIGLIFYIVFYFFILKTSIREFLQKKKHFNSIFFLLLGLLINFIPIIPSGNFFNNYLSIINFLPLGFLIYYQYKRKKRI